MSFAESLYIKRGKMSVISSVTFGVASSVAHDVIMRMGAAIMIIAGLWRYGDWRHVARV